MLYDVATKKCDYQLPYSNETKHDAFYLFNLKDDYHELNDLKNSEPQQFKKMRQGLEDWLKSVTNSQLNEANCRIPQ